MNVYLLNMPFHEEEYVKFSEKWEHIEDEYLGIEIVHSILLQYNCNVKSGKPTNIKDIIRDIMDYKPDVVMIAVMQSSAKFTYSLVQKLRAQEYRGIIFIGGWFAKLAWKEIFNHNWAVDYVCYVNAENVLSKWLSNSREDIFGIATYANYRMQAKLSIKSSLTGAISWANNYIFPQRSPGRKTYCIETSRGCPHSLCTFCSQSCGNCISGKWIPLPLEIVREQILDLNHKYGTTCFATTDDDLIGFMDNAVQRAKEFNEMIKSLPFKISFTASISVKAATIPIILDLLLDCGLMQLCLGFESADEIQLKRYCKAQSLEENFIAAHEVTKRKIPLLPGLITFDPFVTKSTIEKNLSFLFDTLHHYEIGKLTKKLHILTGTPIEKILRKKNLLSGDYLYYDYRFQDESVEKIYNEFKNYTDIIKKFYPDKKMFESKERLQIHKSVVSKILSGENWKEYFYTANANK